MYISHLDSPSIHHEVAATFDSLHSVTLNEPPQHAVTDIKAKLSVSTTSTNNASLSSIYADYSNKCRKPDSPLSPKAPFMISPTTARS
ncbi:hypothetical protein K469DRAFT_213464 [Zopfia rhizophila CBS 207.26]|uniref:Uncharacterized protein n=1 Tax=Zopfia rhizophila CBS 207.26 TaxID=1314779 RepID=A0A6A6DVP0_9PEZI|nr:hypothetical protein K469DRAFT_213464 [Zopfia rhizophila CBS 207.26]